MSSQQNSIQNQNFERAWAHSLPPPKAAPNPPPQKSPAVDNFSKSFSSPLSDAADSSSLSGSKVKPNAMRSQQSPTILTQNLRSQWAHSLPPPKPAPNPPAQKSLTFDEVSKFFSSPLSDAAESLGVCASVLKKICYENGLVRWPYRKFLAGKSIEEIKEDAAREKTKHLNELPKAVEHMNDASASSTVPSHTGPQLQNRTTSSVQELSNSRIVMQQQGNKIAQSGSPEKLHVSSLAKGTPDNLDEFKYGFPSDGLSSVTYRWWGNGSINDNEGICGKNGEDIQSKTDQSSSDSSEPGLLSSLRRKAVKESREALKLGVHRGCGINKLDRTRKMALLQIFKASLPSEWKD